MKNAFLIIACFTTSILIGQNNLLQSGPMLGYAQMMEVLLWVQTTKEAKVQIRYWETGDPKNRKETAVVSTIPEEAFTAKLVADQVEPGKKYEYEVLINWKKVALPYPLEFQTQSLWQWRTDPPDFKIALGSCAYINEPEYDRPGTPYGGDYHIFTSIHKMQPDAMLWLGDNTYLREVDWHSRTGILGRFTHSRSLPELQPLLASTNHYAIWDDHDFGPDNSDRSFIHKDLTLEAFRLFWGNPSFGLPGQKGITSHFQFNDIDFFLLDNRYYRSPDNRKTGKKTMMGEAQLEWLIDALVNSQAPFKMVAIGGQVLNTAEVHETYIHYHSEERDYLLRRIEEEDIKGVVFLTGDRHFTELSHYENAAGNSVYDLTVSPLTSGFVEEVTENNELRVEETTVTQRNFGILEFTGPRTERVMNIAIYNNDGEEVWSKEIMNNE